MQFLWKLTSNKSIGKETMQFLWEIDFYSKYWKEIFAVFMVKLTFN